MKLKRITPLCVSVLTTMLALSVGTAAGQEPATQPPPHYSLIQLGITGDYTFAAGLNDLGLISGYIIAPPNYYIQAFLWPNTIVPTFGGYNSAFEGGTSGFAETATPDPQGQNFCATFTYLICLPLAWPRKEPLPTLGGYSAVGFGNNNLGQVVGSSQTDTLDPNCLVGGMTQPPYFETQAVVPALWKNGHVRALPMVPGDTGGHAFWINDLGQAVGASGSCLYTLPHALLWEPDGSMTNLGSLGGVEYSVASGINDLGEVTGTSDLPGDETFHAFLWRKGKGPMQDLGTLLGDYSSRGDFINNLGQIVGESCDASDFCRAALWENGNVYDLNALSLPSGSSIVLFTAQAINDSGQIVGYAVNLDTNALFGFLAIPSAGGNLSESPAVEVRPATTATVSDEVRNQVKSALQQDLRRRLLRPSSDGNMLTLWK